MAESKDPNTKPGDTRRKDDDFLGAISDLDPEHSLDNVVRLSREALSNVKFSPAVAAYLSDSLKNIYTARQALVSDAQYTTNTLLWLMGAGGAIGGAVYAASLRTTQFDPKLAVLAHLIASVAFFVVLPLGRTLLVKLSASYQLYVAAATHSMIIHKAVGIPVEAHRWLCWSPRFRGHFTHRFMGMLPGVIHWHDPGGREAETVFELEAAWMSEGATLLDSYRALVRILTILSLLAATASMYAAIHYYAFATPLSEVKK